MGATELREKIVDQINALSLEELIFLAGILSNLTAYIESKTKDPLATYSADSDRQEPLINWEDDDFIGSFEADPNLAGQSEQLIHTMFTQRYSET